MKKYSFTLPLLILIALTTSCASFYVTVLEQNSNTAVIKAIGGTPDEAVIRAKQKGREIFGGEIELTKDALCTQEFHATQQGASTYWNCVVSLRKADGGTGSVNQ